MAKTIVALYDNFSDAQAAVEALSKAGISRSNISIMANDSSNEYSRYLKTDATEDVHSDEGAGFGAVVGALIGLGAMIIPGVGPVIAAGPLLSALVGAGVGAAAGAVTGGLTAGLIKLGVDEEAAGYYAEGVRRGGTLVIAHVQDHEESNVTSILNQYNPVDVHERASDWKSSGWTGFDTTSSTPYTSEQIKTERTTTTPTTMTGNEKKLEVVEEELQVGKREVETGGLRIRSYITETPVEEQVTLREEHVHVERRPVDRPAKLDDFVGKEETIEMTERAERAVINKEARVVEEVLVSKDVEEHVETIRDTVRRKDVEVENLGSTQTREMSSQSASKFSDYDTYFREHYNTSYGTSGNNYDFYMPAYQYGYGLATDARYKDYDWDRMEVEARRHWESTNKDNPWEDFKDAVRHAWNKVRGR